MYFKLSFVFGLLALPALAQELVFDMAATDACLAEGGGAACIGRSANACMESSDIGGSNLGMGMCLGQELQAWGDRMSAAYDSVMAKAIEADALMATYENIAAPRQVPALEAMQQDWQAYQGSRCEGFVAALWQGGSGTGIAVTECALQETARQAQFLQSVDKEY